MASKYKQHELTIDMGASRRTNIITNTTFFTMDIKTAKKVINFTLNGERFDLTNATVMLGFEFIDVETTKIIDSKDGSIMIERPRRGECSVVLPNHLYQYSGPVLVHVYIMFDDGRSFDVGIIVTEFKESWLDSELEEMTKFYVKRFEDLAEEIRQRADSLHQLLEDVDKSIVSQDDFDAHVNATINPHPPQTTIIGNAGTATTLQTPRQINGTDFDGSINITTANWGAMRGIAIGNAVRFVDGSQNVAWTLKDIEAAPASHTHPTINVTDFGIDFNTYTEEGKYFFEAEIVGTIRNGPPDGVSGWLEVNTGSTTATGEITAINQRFYRVTRQNSLVPQIWTRIGDPRNNTWTTWAPISMFSWRAGAAQGIYQSGRTMIQSGSVTLSTTPSTIAITDIEFNLPFGSTPVIQTTAIRVDPTNTFTTISNANTTSSFSVGGWFGGGSNTVTVRWLAIGHHSNDSMPTEMFAMSNLSESESSKMYIIVNEDGYVTTVACGGVLPNGIEVEDFDFTEDIRAYKYIDGKIGLNGEKLQQLQNEQLAEKKLQELQEVLSETDAVAQQWWEENELGLEHEMPEQEFQEVMKKRQETRTKMRKLKKVE